MNKPLSVVIFSKDRAAQLDLCLKSIYKNLGILKEHLKIYIIYTASSEEFKKAYVKLTTELYKQSPSVYFFPEEKFGGFQKTLNYCIKHWEDYVLFFTDDDIVYREFLDADFDKIVSDMENENLICISMRLGTNTFVQDQYTNSYCLIPDNVILSSEKIRKWNWKEQPKHINFAYPFSLDGTLFSSSTAKKIIDKTPGYHNPNSLEGKAFACIKDYIDELPDSMGCFEKSCVINTPINRVQETCLNGAGKFFGNTPEELNENFLKGKRLTLEGMDFSTIIGAHQELKLIWSEKCS